MNKSQLERIMGELTAIEIIVEEDTGGSALIKEQLGKLQGTVAQELKNTVWKEYLDTKEPHEGIQG